MQKPWMNLTLVAALLAVGCDHSAPPPEPPVRLVGPGEREQQMYRAGYRDGRDVEIARAREQLATKDAELATLRETAQTAQASVASAKGTEAALASCETELQISRQRTAELEQASSNASAHGSDRAPVGRSEPAKSEPVSVPCCKVCRKGKACGDSCISRAYECHKGPGCACDG
jgi:hypothetical protein